jgi:hypothetical protein
MNVEGGAVNVTTYFMMRLVADGTAATGLTLTTFDLQYTRAGSTPSTKVDGVALAAANSAHLDNGIFEVDATDSPGLYRVDWPDAAFGDGVDSVFLALTYDATVFAEIQKVVIDAPVNVVEIEGVDVGSSDIGNIVSAITIADQFATIIEAQSFLNGYLNTAAWDAANTDNRNKALKESTTRINNLNFKDDYPDTSDVFKEACSLIAARLLDGIDMEAEADSLGIISQGVSSARMTREAIPPHTVAGIPSQVAWNLLLPYMEGLTTVRLDRVS